MADAITPGEFATLVRRTGLSGPMPATPVAVAVSGGADSMALVLLLETLGPVQAVTFDHGLRDASPGEAATVGRWLGTRGIPHTTLKWDGEKPTTGIQKAARDARYRALTRWCRAQGIDALFVGHHQGDQAETFIMRLARGSGLDGLAAMKPLTAPLDGGATPVLVRPLLGQSKARLVATCREFGQDWIEDPSNSNTDFDRIKARHMLAAPPLAGLTVERLGATARRLDRAREALEFMTGEVMRRCVTASPHGFARVAGRELFSLPEEFGLRALRRLLLAYGGGRYPVAADKLYRLQAALAAPDFTGATLAGCVIAADGDGDTGGFAVMREAAACPAIAVKEGGAILWDRRYRVTVTGGPDLTVSALGEAGWAEIAGALDKTDLPPFAARLAVPAIHSAGTLQAVPSFGIFHGAETAATAEFSPATSVYP